MAKAKSSKNLKRKPLKNFLIRKTPDIIQIIAWPNALSFIFNIYAHLEPPITYIAVGATTGITSWLLSMYLSTEYLHEYENNMKTYILHGLDKERYDNKNIENELIVIALVTGVLATIIVQLTFLLII